MACFWYYDETHGLAFWQSGNDFRWFLNSKKNIKKTYLHGTREALRLMAKGWKHVLRKVWTNDISKNHILPSISGGTKSLSCWREDSIMELQRCSVRDNLPNSWLIASLGALAPRQCSSYLLHLNYCASMGPPPRSPQQRAGTLGDRLPQCP